jgi:geranylgeranyl diphosphate synthase type I
MAIATSRATEAQADVLGLVGRSELRPEEVEAIQAVLVDTGALAEVESQIDELAEEALSALDGADLTDDARKALEELAHYVAWREQ